MTQSASSFRFGDITVDPRDFRITREGHPLVVSPRAFDVLVVLLENAGHLVEKQEIFDAVWKDTFVTDNALSKIIRELRHALHDDAEHPQLIETVPKRGYRFIADVSRNTEVAQSEADNPIEAHADEIAVNPSGLRPGLLHRPALLLAAGLVLVVLLTGWIVYRRGSTEASTEIKSIAVLPFKPLSADSRDESLEMGMAETLINRLSNLRHLAVRPITSVRKFTDASQDPVKAGEETQVEAVLDGTIQKAGDRIRITVRLIDVGSGKPIWNDKFDESLTDIFKVQDSIADRVTNALVPQLSSREREQLARHETADPDVYQQYLQCQLIFHGRRANWIIQSQECYKAVIQKDPNFAMAYVGLAETYILLTGRQQLPPVEGGEKARQNIARALEIDPNLAQAHNALAELKYQFDYDWKGADEEFKRALELNPNVSWIHVARCWFLMSQGNFDEAKKEIETAKYLDPTAMTVDVIRGRLYFFSRDYEASRQTFERLLTLEPNDLSLRIALFAPLERQGKYPEAAEQLFEILSGMGVPPERVQASRMVYEQGGWDALHQHQLEQMKRSEKEGRLASSLLANEYARLGRKEDVFEALGRAFDKHEHGILQLKVDPLYDFIRDDPRYPQLLARIGLTP